jgi:hypothetical protein
MALKKDGVVVEIKNKNILFLKKRKKSVYKHPLNYI